MSENLTCNQVSALLSFYIDDKLSCQLKQFVDAHLAVCPTCRSKLESLRSIVTGLREAQQKLATIKQNIEKVQNNNPQYDEFKSNLSAYIDNELNDTDNIKIKKYIISNQKARQDLENMYDIKKVMHDSFEKTKNEVKDDFSKNILKKIDFQEEIYGNDSFGKVVAILALILFVFTITAVIIFGI